MSWKEAICGIATLAAVWLPNSCAPISREAIKRRAQSDVCRCTGMDCSALPSVPVRFGGSVVFCGDEQARGCYSKADGISVATISGCNPKLAEGERCTPPWTFTSDYELTHQLRHEYLHALGICDGDELMRCQWEP